MTLSACAAAALALVLAGPALAAKQPVPAALTAAESNAEDIVDAALAHDRSSVVSIAQRLKATANGQVSSLRRDGVPAALVAELRQRADRVAAVARGGTYVQVLLASNAVSALMPDLYAHFASPVPPAIQALDYLDREVQFRSLAGEPAKVTAAVKELERTWAHLRPKVVAAGGRTQAAAYAAHVSALVRVDPRSGARVQAEAAHGLALVDTLEQVFG